MTDYLIYLCIFGYFYIIKYKLYLNIFDPLQMLVLTETIIFITIYNLPYISFGDRIYFISGLFIYSIFWILFSVFCKGFYFTAIRNATEYLAKTNWRSIQILQALLLAISLTLVLAGQLTGFIGDARLSLTKLFRPLEALWTIGFYIYLTSIHLSNKRSFVAKFIISPLMCFFFVSTFGKGFILNILLPISLVFWHRKQKVRISDVLKITFLLMVGVILGLVAGHGAALTNVTAIVQHRIINDSDIYILGLSEAMISQLELSNFVTYVFGPFLKILGLAEVVDFNIGAQIGSIIAGKQVFTGPNAQLSYLGYVYFNDNLILGTIACTILIAFWFTVKTLILIYTARASQMTIFLIFLILYAIVYPQSVLKDPTFTASFFITTLSTIFVYVLSKSLARVLLPTTKLQKNIITWKSQQT